MGVLRIGVQDNDRTLEILAQDQAVLELPENPTTGFRWDLAKNESIVVVRDETKLASSKTGGGGIRELCLQFKAKGPHSIELKHWRDWEGDESIIERFTVTVLVR